MKQRNPVVVALVTLITFGIYGIIWSFQTASEMRVKGAQIPTTLLIFVPFVSIYWLYRYCQAVDQTTGSKPSTTLSFVLTFLTGVIGMAIIQNGFNNVTASGEAPVGQPQPVASQPTQDPSFTPGATGAAVAAAPVGISYPEQFAQASPEPQTVAIADSSVETTPVVPPTVVPDVVAPVEEQFVASAPVVEDVPQDTMVNQPVVQPQSDTQETVPSEPQSSFQPVQPMPPLEGSQQSVEDNQQVASNPNNQV